MTVLREAINNVHFWAVHFRTETSSESDPIQLIPEDWNSLVSYVSRQLPDSAPLAAKASQGLRNVEGTLNRLVRTPYNQRGPNSSLGAGFDSLATNLDNVRKLLDETNAVLSKDVIHTSAGQIS